MYFNFQPLGNIEAFLKTLNVDGNPLENFPSADLVPRKIETILSFLVNQKQDGILWRRVKVLVLGKENVGKTTIVSRIVGTKAKKATELSDRKGYVSTEGIEVSNWDPNIEKAASKPPGVTGNDDILYPIFQFWDFGGQEIFYPTHQFFLSIHSIFVVVFRLTDPDYLRNIEYWMEVIKMTVPLNACPILLVGTHLDLCPSKAAAESIKEKVYKRFRDRTKSVLLISSSNVTPLRTSLRNLWSNVALRFRVSGSQIFLVHQLNEMRKNQNIRVLQWDRFKTLSIQCGIPEVDVISTSRYLHDLGWKRCCISSSRFLFPSVSFSHLQFFL